MSKSKLSKANRLANNIQIMLRSKGGGSLCINSSNEKAFQLAVKKVGMKLDDFCIEHDGFYLEIRLKQHFGKDTRIVPSLLKRPELPKCHNTPSESKNSN